MRFHLAQVNVSRLLEPLRSERLRPFVEREFAYRDPRHVGALRRRREFFTHDEEATLALWWIEAGTPPGGGAVPVGDDRELCPAP